MGVTSIPNPVAPLITVILDRERHLKFGWNAKVALEYEVGRREKRKVNFLKVKEWNRQFSDMNCTNVQLLLWAGLVWEDSELSIESVGDLLDEHIKDFKAICEAVSEALKRHVLSMSAAENSGGDSRGRPLAEEKTPAAT